MRCCCWHCCCCGMTNEGQRGRQQRRGASLVLCARPAWPLLCGLCANQTVSAAGANQASSVGYLHAQADAPTHPRASSAVQAVQWICCSSRLVQSEAAATTSQRPAEQSISRTILCNELCCFVHDSPDVRGWQDHADGLGLQSEHQTQHTCTRTIIVICKYDTVRWQHYYRSMQRPTPRLSCCCCRL